jgi:hypothetical protein
MYEYKNAINILTNRFSEMDKEFLSDKDFYEDIPYVFYESVFVKYVVMQIEIKNVELMKKIFVFIEDILENGDDELKELIDVAVVESLFSEENAKQLIEDAQTLFGKLTKLSFARFNNSLNQLNNSKIKK